MHVEPHDPPDRLAELIRAGPRARVARRLAAVRLALLGHTAALQKTLRAAPDQNRPAG